MNSNYRYMATVFVICVSVLFGCSTERGPGELFSPDGAGTIVVDATLIVDSRFPNVFVSRTLAPNITFSPEKAGELGATVLIKGPGEEIAFIEQSETFPGLYRPQGNSRIEPNARYDLRVVTAKGEVVTATTRTPARLSVKKWVLLEDDGGKVRRNLLSTLPQGAPPDSLYSAPQNQLIYADGLLELRLDPLNVPAYEIGILSLDDGSDFVIDPDFIDEEDLRDFEREISSPPLEAADGRIRLPWFAIFFEGRYDLRVFALDRNWYDFSRTTANGSGQGFGFGGTFGDNFERPIFHVEGGIGLFGSASRSTIGVYIHPRP